MAAKPDDVVLELEDRLSSPQAFAEFLGGLGGPNSMSDIHDKLGNMTLLHIACLMNDPDQVAKLLRDKTVDISATDENRSTPLHLACQAGNKEIVELLIQERANRLKSASHENDAHSKIKSFFNLTDNHENTPLGLACIGGHTDIVELLLKQEGVEINHTNSQKRTPLGMACIEGHTQTVKLLLEHGADVNVTDENELTPLGNASIPGHTEIVKLLLNRGVANVDHPDKDDDTPLIMACVGGHKEVVELLLEKGANVNKANKKKLTPLGMTCIAGHKKIVELLLKHGAIVNVPVEDIDAPLGIACVKRNKEIVELLLDHDGVDINHRNSQGRTSLVMTCIAGYADIVELLLKYKADVNIADDDKDAPLGIACHEGHAEIVKLLLEKADVTHTNEKGCTPLGMACIGGCKEAVELLLEHDKVDFDAIDCLENTPLGNACLRGYTQIVEALLKHGVADINHTNKQERTPLAMACIEGHTKIVKLLLKEGADVNVTDKNRLTPLCNASIPGHTEIVELLLEHGVDNVNHTDKDNDTPLDMACIGGHKKIVELLLKHKADANHTNEQKHTPLVLAHMGGHAEIVELLKKNGGVDINVTDERKNTPLVVACIKGQKEVVEILLKSGAKVDVTDEQNNTPLGIACIKGHTEIVELLLNHGIHVPNTNNMNDKNCILLGMASAEGQQHQIVNVNHTNSENHTALHSACIKGHAEIVKLLLKHGANVTKYDEKGLNALDIAVEEGKKDAAMAIVTSDKWKDALRNCTATRDESADEVRGIRRIWCCKKKRNHGASKQFTTPMRRIIKKMPDVAKVVFEKCCEKENPPDHPDHEITFNYEFLDDFNDNDMKTVPQSKYSSENHCLNILADLPSADLLKHPLAATLLDQKWNKYGRIVYYTNLIFYFLFVILLTSYALTVHPPNSNICMEVFENDTDTSIDCLPEERFVSQGYISIASTCLIVYSAILIIREAFQLVLFREEYLSSFVNFIEVPLFIFTIIFASVRSDQCYCTRPWQWQVGVIAVFLSWIVLVFSIRKLPVVGIYAVMFNRIFNNFIKAVLLALLLISAFAIPLYMMFNDPQDRAEGIRTPFITPWRTIIKTITMTMGEYEMDSLLRQNNQRTALDVQYPVVAFSLIIVFVVLMPILFLNLLTGLAVGDTDKIRKSAEIYRRTLRVEFTLPVEEFLRTIANAKRLPKKVKSWIMSVVTVEQQYIVKPNQEKKGLKHAISNIQGYFTTEPEESVDELKNKTKPLSEEVKGLHSAVTSVSEEVKDLRSSMNQLLAIVNSMNERQGGGGEVRELEEQ